jgi:MFS transporter, DHA1 family, multidrug resistance protein
LRTSWFILLVLLFGFQPVTTDLYLATLPELAAGLHVSVKSVQSTLTTYLVAYALVQLITGPLSDRFGRRPVLLLGIALHCGASFAGAFATDLTIMNLMRAIQAIGCCCAVVCGRAIVRDLFEPEIGSRLFAKVLTFMGFVALTCPLIGGALLSQFGWQAAFYAMGVYALLVLLLAAGTMIETNRYMNPQATEQVHLIRIYKGIVKDRLFWGYTLISTGSYSGLIAFFPNSSAVLMKTFGLSPVQYGLVFALCTIGFILGTVACRKLLPTFGGVGFLRIASIGTSSVSALMLALVLAQMSSVVLLISLQVFYMFCHGIIQPIAQSGAVATFPKTAGAAAALLGFFVHCGAALGLLALSTTAPALAWPIGLLAGAFFVVVGAWLILPKNTTLSSFPIAPQAANL